MKKQLTQKDKGLLRKSLRKLVQKDTVIVYCFAIKQSEMGITSNERLILLNSAQKSIRYYSKPPDTLPFSNLSEIPEGKSKIIIDKAQNFKYEACKGKSSTMKIQWQQNKKKYEWVITFATTKMMHEWIAAIDEVISGKINTDPTFVIPEQQNPKVDNKIDNKSIGTPINNLTSLANEPVKNTGSNTQLKPNDPNYKVSYTAPNQPQPQTGTATSALQNNTGTSDPKFILSQPPQLNKNSNLDTPANKSQQQPNTNNPITGTTTAINKPIQPNTTTQPQPPTTTLQQVPTNTQPQQLPQTQQQPTSTNTNPTIASVSPPKQLPAAYLASNPQFGDVAGEIAHLRQNGYKKFNLTNQLSQKKLPPMDPAQSQVQQSKDDVETKRQVYGTQPNQQPNTQPINANPTTSAFIKKSPNQIPSQPSQPQSGHNSLSQAQAQTQPKPISQANQLPQPPPVRSDYIKQSNVSNRSIGDQNYVNRYKYDESRRSQAPHTSIKTANQMSQFYPQEQPYQSNRQKQMHRTHSQQPHLHISKFNNNNNSRIRSEANYSPHISDNIQQSRNNRIKSHKKWNQLWCSTTSPLQLYQQFVKECESTSIQIVDELPLIKSNRQYSPLKYQSPYYMYSIRGIVYNMHYFGDQSNNNNNNSNPDTGRSLDERAPLLYDHQSYTQAKRQFYNYNLILSVTGNRTIIKVPLSCYIQYKGILVVCKATIPQGFDKVQPQQCQQLLQEMEQLIKMRFIFNSMSVYVHPMRKYYLLADMEQLIPRLPIDIHPPAYFRKQYLLTNNIMIQDTASLNKIYNKMGEDNIKEFVNRFQNLQTWVINSHDLLQEMHRCGISMGSINTIYEQASFVYFRKILLSEMTKNVFCDILRSQLNSVYASFPARQFDDLTVDYADKIILDCAHIMLNQLFSYSSRSQNIWRLIVKEVNRKYKVVISKEDIIPGYLLGGIMTFSGIDCDYKTPNLNRKQTFFVKQSTIPRDLLLGFYPRVRRYDLDAISPLVARVQQILTSQPKPDSFQELVRTLDLRNSQIPQFLYNIRQEIIMYMCNFIPLGEHDQFSHIGIYDMLELQPHNYCSSKISLLAIKWAAKKKNQELANKIFQIKFQQNAFWVSQFNPAISEYYDFFSLYNFSTGNFQQAIKLAKSSLVNSIKLSGANSLPVADKHYQLGDIFFKIGRKQQALKQYLKTKQTLQNHRRTSIPEYGVILLKLSLLYLNFGKVSDCVGSCLDALKIFDTNGGNEQQQIQTFQILSRSYEITRKVGDLNSVGALCGQKFNNTENPKILERMMKIVLFPKLTSVNAQDAKTLLKLLSKLQQLQSPITYNDAFNYLHARSQNEIVTKKIFSIIDNISNLYQDVIRRDLLRKHKALSNQAKLQASQMLIIMEAVVTMTGYNFINGCLKEYYY